MFLYLYGIETNKHLKQNKMQDQNNIKPVSTTKVEFFITAKFPTLNKQDNWIDYEKQLDETSSMKVRVDEIITLSCGDFYNFKNSLLSDQEWLEGKGGTESTFKITRDIENFWEMTEEERENWRYNSFNVCVMVQDVKGRNILVDPQGYKYARYCGVISAR